MSTILNILRWGRPESCSNNTNCPTSHSPRCGYDCGPWVWWSPNTYLQVWPGTCSLAVRPGSTYYIAAKVSDWNWIEKMEYTAQIRVVDEECRILAKSREDVWDRVIVFVLKAPEREGTYSIFVEAHHRHKLFNFWVCSARAEIRLEVTRSAPPSPPPPPGTGQFMPWTLITAGVATACTLTGVVVGTEIRKRKHI